PATVRAQAQRGALALAVAGEPATDLAHLAGCLPVPPAQRPVQASRDEGSPIRQEDHPDHVSGMSDEPPDLTSAGQLPLADEGAVVCREQAPALVPQSQAVDRLGKLDQAIDLVPREPFPQPHRAILATGQHLGLVGAELGIPDTVLVPLEALEF